VLFASNSTSVVVEVNVAGGLTLPWEDVSNIDGVPSLKIFDDGQPDTTDKFAPSLPSYNRKQIFRQAVADSARSFDRRQVSAFIRTIASGETSLPLRFLLIGFQIGNSNLIDLLNSQKNASRLGAAVQSQGQHDQRQSREVYATKFGVMRA
jgi:hypothetical protein